MSWIRDKKRALIMPTIVLLITAKCSTPKGEEAPQRYRTFSIKMRLNVTSTFSMVAAVLT